jgi:iron complex outermembrane recepter protein
VQVGSIARFGTLAVASVALASVIGAPANASAPERADGNQGEEIVVTADRIGSFGADFVQAGTFRDSTLRDTPLTVTVVPRALLDAQEARALIDAVRNSPGVTQSQINSAIYSNLSIRGIAANNFTNFRWNGVLPVVNLVDQPIESKDRIEVLKGAAGLYYGFATPSGIVNLVTERPGAKPVMRFEILGNSRGSIGGSADIGRTFGTFGIRVNGGVSLLETGVKRSSGERSFVTGAFDWKPSDSFSVKLDAEYIYKTITEPTEFALTAANGVITLPPLQAASKNLGDEWMQAKGWETNLLARANYAFAPDWRVSFAAGQSYLSRERRYSSFSGYDLTTGNGTVGVAMTSGNDYRNVIYRGDIAGVVRTGPIEHNLLAGVSLYLRDGYVPTAVRVRFAQNLYDPVFIPRQPTPPRGTVTHSKVRDLGVFLFDRATLGDWLQLTFGYRKTEYSDDNYREPAGGPATLISTYKIKPDTFSYGAMVKPVRWANIYANYIEGLEPGAIAQQIANNAGEILPAAISKQKEVGLKLEPIRGLLLTGAWFHIRRASAYLNSANFFVQDGQATYEGFEFSATGEITPNLSIHASALTLDAVQESGDVSVVGKRVENTPEFSGSAFLEYRPSQVAGLSLTAGLFHVGRRAVNALNQGFAPGYTTFDFGASYAFDLLGNRTTARIYGENVTGKRYWAATGSGLLQQGLPFAIRFSLSTAF